MTTIAQKLRRALLAAAIGGLAAAPIDAVAKPPKHGRPAAQKKKPAAPKKGKTKGGKVALAGVREVAGEHASDRPIAMEIPVQRFTLDNGLRVVINVDHTSPTVAVAVTYDVGSRDEERGRSGFAHLFEHMMFQGSANVEKGEHMRLVSGHGGTLNGTTNADRTNYYEVLPANEVALGVWLEADRMRSLSISAENFENQRKVVQEEYRMRYGNAAYGMAGMRLDELVYQGYWPYEHSTIGSMADLDGAELDWVRDFHARHYGPNNAVLAIAGDVDAAEVTALVHKHFDAIPKIQVTPFQDLPLPEQTSQRTAILKDDHARTPAVLYGWAVPGARHADFPPLELLGVILADGESSRLYQQLVRDKALCQGVSAGARGRRGPGEFRLDAVLTEGARTEDVERLIEAEIKAIATRGPSDAELLKAKRQVEAGIVLGLQSNGARARRLGEFELFWGDAGLLAGELPRYFAATKADLQRVAAKYLGPTTRTIVEAVPADRPDAKPEEHGPAKAKAPAKKPGKAPAKKPGKAKKRKS